ncbi:hypothetical protein YC2023_057052 [Brassica napus]
MKLPRGSMTILALYIFIHHMEALEVGGLTQELINGICIESGDYELCKKIIHKHLETKTTNLLDLTHRSHIPHRY